MKAYSRVKATVSLDAVLHNFEAMRNNLKEGTRIIAVIKADGYGHGAIPIARLMESKEYIWGFAVATAEEALELRKAGIAKPILILGYVFPEYYRKLIQEEVRLTVFRWDVACEINEVAAGLGKKAYIHLALDTGMTRIGFPDTRESVETIRKIAESDWLVTEGLFTHFARADETDKAPAYVQLQRYQDFVSWLEETGISIPVKHCSNSAGILRIPEANLDAVRAGITIYGIYPSLQVERDTVRLQPVMELKSHIAHIKTVEAGVAVSYGGTYVTKGKTVIATIPVGYADGYSRGLSNRGFVLIHGKKAPILGRVCMDQFMVDITEIPEAAMGDEVTLFGENEGAFLSVEELGEISGRFSYEFVCEISKRVPRVYIRHGREIF
ncbi:MAG TPA: alanine racemase [Candidatus Blautia gallistercoris]|uniref:Alanine racemase n=1 Tax=Candidatus Blautia gallistercoris TaxID=2838490 RepID=A0A9D1WG00_9FIRM|nr:alanine racemase [Candidatus Blautia gallistercoris]